jgi:uncharacterized membrane protein YkvI
MNQTQSSDTIGRESIYTTTRLLLAAAALVFLAYLVGLLPGIDRLLPETPVTVAALIGAVITAVVVALLVSVAPKLATLARTSLDWPAEVVENLASVVYWLVVLLAVLVAHRGFAGLVQPLFGGLGWLYDVAFLLVALPAVVVVAARLYAGLDPATELVTDRVVDSEE